ncbi:ATP-binding protein [Myxococcota bacterium]|nr:ATP-binding protein [Myxococcota bacterium]
MQSQSRKVLDHREFPVLYVDDEPENLRVFELAFRRQFSILTAQSAEEGLCLLNENPIAVVLSDQRMPGVSGVEFLSRVRSLDPTTIRILVTAYGDAEILGEAINDGSIYRYVPKPWEPEDMRVTLCRAIEHYALERERSTLLSELALLNQLSEALHREIDLSQLVKLLLQATHEELGFDGAALLFWEEEGERLTWRGQTPTGGDLAPRLREVELVRSEAPDFFEKVAAGQSQTLRSEGLAECEPGIREWVREVAADEILVVPLMGGDGPIGVLAVDNRSGGRRLGAEDQTLLDGLAVQAVIAIENARLVENLRDSRRQVLRADRLGTLGTMAAGIAHEINNPLVSLQTFLTLAPEKRDETDPSFWSDYHALAVSELERIRGLVSTMSRLARGGGTRDQAERGLVDLAELAREVIELTRPEAESAQVRLSVDFEPTVPKVLGSRDQLHQVLLNLLMNGVQACESGGRVKVRVGPASGQPQECVQMVVSDSGAGIESEYIDRIFDPFFTTKDPDRGTGLGLMIAHQIVADHGGSIGVRSRPGEGANFTVLLPVASDGGGQGSA